MVLGNLNNFVNLIQKPLKDLLEYVGFGGRIYFILKWILKKYDEHVLNLSCSD